MFHPFKQHISTVSLPSRFNNPFYYTVHPLCEIAAKEVQNYIETLDVKEGKMYGVLVIETSKGELGYLAAFSGLLNGINKHPFFVPPIYDLLLPDGYFKEEESNISAINAEIKNIQSSAIYQEAIRAFKEEKEQYSLYKEKTKTLLKEAKIARDEKRKQGLTDEQQAEMIRESQFMKAQCKREEIARKERVEEKQSCLDEWNKKVEQLKSERKRRSAELQGWLFDQYTLRNNRGETKSMHSVFEEVVSKTPPGGSGECAGPKLLQYAYINKLRPIVMAEFWWGESPQNEIRKEGVFYPSCNEKCKPILSFMLQGLAVDENPLDNSPSKIEIEVVFEDDYLVVVNKPSGVLSVPGKQSLFSIYQWAKERYPDADGPLVVHRLDMDTSGLLLIAKTKEIHKSLQEQFANRIVSKKYIALLDGYLSLDKGTVSLPLCCDPTDRPRQMVNYELGKSAITEYEVIERREQLTKVRFTPHTGRTHQLRMHAAHHKGLNAPIVGDALYGNKAERLYLHAEKLSFIHPINKELITLEVKANF